MILAENIVAFHHYSLKVNDFEKTLKFYDSLGFEEVHSWSLPSFKLKKAVMIYNKNINCYIELFDKDAEIPTQGRKRQADDEYIENSILHICFMVKDAEKAREEAIKNGAFDLSKGVHELLLSNDKKPVNVRNSLVYSPNGEVIEFLENVHF
ncbi:MULTISPECIES: VOC family protein [unclassified Empedobacter]|uniref:VOC family protein n=1 Tax=Empedobacter TaxID=59734 RepID=UPI002447059E|nr:MULTISPECIES: VOC family protein [unclassified Empedobacter]MDH1882590.1 VOC family protein [Empedobacter sp. GD03797]